MGGAGKLNTARWERGYAALCKFREREGHCCPLRFHVERGFNLGAWVSDQRYRRASLPLERKRRLDAIGFVWAPIGRSLGRSVQGAFEVQTPRGALLRADLSL